MIVGITMKHKNKSKILFTILIMLFMLLNYSIIAYGHTLTYDVENNNCTHMSSQLEGMFESFGIPVTLMSGGACDGSRHMWIRIGLLELDSVNLMPVVNSRYNENMREYECFGDYEKTRK